jgi:hypothetical protein
MAASTSPTNTYLTFLMHSTNSGSSYTDLCPIKDYPDFLNDVATIDVTDLQNAMHTYIQGLKDTGGDMTFTANYIPATYQSLNQLTGDQYLALYFGGTVSGTTVTPDGHDGIWKFQGRVSVGIVGKGTDEAREMQIHITPSTDMVFSLPA